MTELITTYIEQQLRDQGDEIAVRPDDDLVLIGYDSVSYVRLLAYIKSTFGLSVPDADVTVENFGSVVAISQYLDGRGAKVGTSS
ncbi:MAG: acyl carrier protein [Acidimicrobiia bacterium]|nr:acyl carrier protein [Acidimicrobiia bacterium]NNF64650.1 acyl carrier protein [Acidimicrobiia bacterium]